MAAKRKHQETLRNQRHADRVPPGAVSQAVDVEKYRHDTSIVASVVNLVRPMTVAGSSH